MRFERLSLIRYGKFTGEYVELPRAKQDFHLIVGPNEAGKSTFRASVLDLLFGFERNKPSPYGGFLHEQNDLRIGGIIEDDSAKLEFQRKKGNKNTLLNPTDQILSDDALVGFLGTTDRPFFDQMFGLDHQRLVEGGESILSATDDVGQILFQSAAGISQLGEIRKALEIESSQLWAPKKSADRAYYIADKELGEATAALKAAIVRTKDWVEAQTKVADLEQNISETFRKHSHLEINRNQLERARRIAPFVIIHNAKKQELLELGQTTDLPTTASKTLSDALIIISQAQTAYDLFRTQEDEADESLKAITVDEAIFGFKAEIENLDMLRIRFSAHEQDLLIRRAEVLNLWTDAKEAAKQLQWDADSEESLSNLLPSALLRARTNGLIGAHAALNTALVAAKDAYESKKTELRLTIVKLNELPVAQVPMALTTALSSATKMGDTVVKLEEIQGDLAAKEAAFETTSQNLGRWRMAGQELRALVLPSHEAIARNFKERSDGEADARSVNAEIERLVIEISAAELEITHFQQAHAPVRLEEVIDSRKFRDLAWKAIKLSDAILPNIATEYERNVSESDLLADRRHDKAQETSELQAKEQALERLKQREKDMRTRLNSLNESAREREIHWAELMKTAGLVDMPLDAISAWIIIRQSAIQAENALDEAKRELERFENALTSTHSNLLLALVETGIEVPHNSILAALCLHANQFVNSTAATDGRRSTLVRQRDDAEAALESLKRKSEDAQGAIDQWNLEWTNVIGELRLNSTLDVKSAEGIMQLVGQIDLKLQEIRKLRLERINTMEADLKNFETRAKSLAIQLDAELEGLSSIEISIELGKRLIFATELNGDKVRLTNGKSDAAKKANDQKNLIQTTSAGLQSLKTKANAQTIPDLEEAISRSEKKRQLEHNIEDASRKILEGGDGLPLLTLESQVQEVDLINAPGEIQRLENELSSIRQTQRDLSVQLSAAQLELSKIAGASEAALAESQRQEALSKMSDAVERYLKVFTASRLLRWSIDRYREEKQGPMLEKAGAIFSKITALSFKRLSVDFDSEPMVLQGIRNNGKAIDTSGMSTGTRDQLYFALRLAALYMHIEQAHPLPFIADDLFINFDDARSKAGLEALAELSEKTQVIFLTHHDHLVPTIREVLGNKINVITL